MIELVAVAGGVAVPLLGFIFRLQSRIVVLETWREAMTERLNGFEQRILDALRRIEDKLDGKQDREFTRHP